MNFVSNNIPLNKIYKDKSQVLHTHTLFNIENIDPESQELFINLHRVNDQRRINKYFIQVNENLKCGAYFVGSGTTITEIHKKFFQNQKVGELN